MPFKVPKGQQGSGIPQNVLYGPKYFSSFKNFPNARYIVDVPFAYNNLSNSLGFVGAAVEAIGKENIFALEIGNEVNLYGSSLRQDWSPAEYAKQWTHWADEVSDRTGLRGKKVFQAAAISAVTTNVFFEAYREDDPWEIPNMFRQGLGDERERITQASVHYYQTKANTSSNLQRDIMNHTAVVLASARVKEAVRYLKNEGVPLVLGEIGNTLGNKSDNSLLEKTLGSALWQADAMMYWMSIGVNKVNSQLGVVFDFSLWSVEFEKRKQEVNAAFYGQILAAEFIDSGESVIVKEFKTGSDTLSAYAAYGGGKLAKVALTNLQLWSSKECIGDGRPSQKFTLAVDRAVMSAKVKRLTSPCGGDATAQRHMTFGGMMWRDSDGVGVQVGKVETVQAKNRKLVVSVPASQAVLLELQN